VPADPLTELPALVRVLREAVLNPTDTPGSRAMGAGLPISTSAHDLLFNPDHHGHLGIVPGLAALERVTRLALGDSTVAGVDVARSCDYLAAQAVRLVESGSWSPAASAAVEDVVDGLLSRIDAARVRLDWELSVRRAGERLADVLAFAPDDAEHLERLVDEAEALAAVLACDYIDYEGRLFDAITSRYMGSCDAGNWAGLVWTETAHMAGAAKALLGLAEHSRAPLATCPFCGQGGVGLNEDPNEASCDRCGKHGTVEMWAAWSRAFTEAGHPARTWDGAA
jgi:hypothetical protein